MSYFILQGIAGEPGRIGEPGDTVGILNCFISFCINKSCKRQVLA